LSLSFKNANELNGIIDHELPIGRPKFKREQIIVAGEAFDVYYRDVIDCVKSLYGDPDFAKYLAFAPERHYSDKDETIRLFHDMHTGKWWWDTQVRRTDYVYMRYDTYDTLEKTRPTQSRRHHYSHHYLIRQNTSNIVPQQVRLSRLSHHWQHSKGNPTQAFTWRAYTSSLFAMYTARAYHHQGFTAPNFGKPLSRMLKSCSRSTEIYRTTRASYG
jgi:hypothetical protein